MFALSQHQRVAAESALAAKEGEIDPDQLAGEERDLYDVLTEGELREIAYDA